ncbi:MAG: PKD domain-containing protein, partial [Planctomycetaceae bacterium]
MVSPLTVDHTPPQASLISPVANDVNTGVGNTIVVEFSEAMRPDSVASLAPWSLTEAGLDGVHGTSDDVQIPLQSVTYSAVTRRATLTLPLTVIADGNYRLTVEGANSATAVVDVSGNRLNNGVNQIFGITVNSNGPEISTAISLSGSEGQLLTLVATVSNPGSSGPHAATVNWGDGTATAGTVIFSSGTGTVTGRHAYADDGNYAVTVTVTDSSAVINSSARTGSRTTTAAIANFVPTVVAGPSRSVIVGTPLSGVIATYTDQGYSDAAVSASETFTGSIHWGDGSPIQTAALTVTNGAAGVLTLGNVSGTHTFAGIGTYTVTITVSDDDGGAGLASFQVTVTAAPQPPAISGPATVAEGAVYVLTLNANNYSPTAWNINWGDGTFIQTVPGNATSVAHTYTDNQMATITATAVSNSGSVTAAPLTVTVLNVAPTISINGLNSIGVGTQYSLSVSASDPGTDTVSSWIVNWGDGATSTVAGTLTTLTHVYTVAATRTIRVSAMDEDATFTGPSKTITVITITGNKPRFFVVDSQSDKAFRYGSTGVGPGDFTLGSSKNVRGVTTNGAGNPIWTIDNDDRVYVYDSVAGTLTGSWKATSVNNPEDIATDGTDLWILDRSDDKVYRFAGAASRRSGSQSAVSSFRLHSQNGDAYGLATDGTKLWVVDKNASAVFIYNVSSGAYLGKWTIDSRNKQPTGITIDPNGGSDMWIVDRQT